MTTETEYAIVRHLSEFSVVITTLQKVMQMTDIESTGRVLRGLKEYIHGTLTERSAFKKRMVPL